MPIPATVARLYVDAAGKPIIVDWTNWKSHADLRWSKSGKLQQRWWRQGLSSMGFLTDNVEHEWRDVPNED